MIDLVDFAVASYVTGMAGAVTIPFIPSIVSWWDNRQTARRAVRAASAASHPVNRPRPAATAASWIDRDTKDVLQDLWTDLDPELRAALITGDVKHLASESG